MLGKVLHNEKFGYGVGWKTDRYDRLSVKFETGKEVGGLSLGDVRVVEKEEFKEKDVLGRLKSAGLDRYIDSEDVNTRVKVNEIISGKNFFEKMLQQTDKVDDIPEIVDNGLQLLNESEMDGFTKNKIKRRLSRIENVDKLKSYIKNSFERYRQLDEKYSIGRLSLILDDVIENFNKEREYEN